jgi:hypothetical protein
MANIGYSDSQSRIISTILAILGAFLAIVGWWRWAS